MDRREEQYLVSVDGCGPEYQDVAKNASELYYQLFAYGPHGPVINLSPKHALAVILEYALRFRTTGYAVALRECLEESSMRQQKDNAELLGDVFVFGRMPFEGGRRQVGIDAQGPVFGPREHKGSLATWDKPVTGSGRAVKKPKKSGKKRY